MPGDLLYTLINYLPVFLMIIVFGKAVEALYNISKTAEQTQYLIEKVEDLERRLRRIDHKLK